MIFEALVIIGIMFGFLYYFRNNIAEFIIKKTANAAATVSGQAAKAATDSTLSTLSGAGKSFFNSIGIKI